MHGIETHLVFVNGPDIDALAPALDPRFGVRQFVVLAEDSQQGVAVRMAEVLADSEIVTQWVPLADGWQREAIVESLEQALSAASGSVALNLSAANPVQAAWAADWARQRQLPVFAVEPVSDRLIWISAPAHFREFNVADRLTLDGYFNAFGIVVESVSIGMQTRWAGVDVFLRKWVPLLVHAPEKATQLRNALHGKSAGDLLPRWLNVDLQAVLRSLSSSGLVSVLPNQRLQLRRPDSVGFLSGGWLEHYVMLVLHELASELPIQDAALGVKLKAETGVSCEFDVVLLYNNTLFVIECKSGVSTSTSPLLSLFKLDSLTSQAGLDAEALLASLAQLSDNEQGRARWHGIGVAAGSDLLNIKACISQWLHSFAG